MSPESLVARFTKIKKGAFQGALLKNDETYYQFITDMLTFIVNSS